VLGSIAAGTPIFAQQELMGYEIIPENDHIDFCLRVKGDSMTGARIFDGDIVFIRNQPDVEHGEIAAVIVEGEEATLKRVYKAPNTIILHPENPAHKDLVFSGRDAKQVNIIGKAVSFKSEVR
ncbi:XRE family transcriptional regulator, partial [bacterium]